MSYTAVPTVANEDEISASWWNTYVRDNFEAGIPAIFASKGDLSVASAADTATVLSAGTNTQCIEADSGESEGIKNSWNFVPVGGIIMWGGDLGDLPSNWQICDGTNGTPNLQDRFVLGAGDSYAVGNTGGAETINLQHANTGVAVTSEDGDHTHTVGDTSEAHSNHYHDYIVTSGGIGVEGKATSGSSSRAQPYHQHYYEIEPDGDDHTHEVTDTPEAGDHTHPLGAGTNALSATQDIRPKYYALAYIMRLN